jgi:hypothetical protein
MDAYWMDIHPLGTLGRSATLVALMSNNPSYAIFHCHGTRLSIQSKQKTSEDGLILTACVISIEATPLPVL